MVDCEHCEQRELVAVDPLDELISLGEDIHGTLSVIMDFYREQSLERTHQALVPIVDDEAGTASDELAFDIVADLRNPIRQDPIRGVMNRGVIGTTAAASVAITVLSSAPRFTTSTMLANMPRLGAAGHRNPRPKDQTEGNCCK